MTVHVVGAGLAGLAASVRLAVNRERVVLYEAAPQAGGRCRSFEEKSLGRVIDNGNHLLLSGNRSALGYLKAIGAEDSLIGPAEARFPFADLRNGDRWEICINRGRLPSWILNPRKRVPGSGVFNYLASARLAMAREATTVAGCLRSTGVLWERFWDPLATAVLNTPSEIGSARLLWAAVKESFSRGGDACRPLIARESLAASFVDPALSFLTQYRADLYFGQRLRSIDVDRHVKNLNFHNLAVALDPGDHVILALPPSQVADLVPMIDVPGETHAIVNAHFLLPAPKRLPKRSMLMGLVGGTAQWLFLRDRVASLTVSAADRLADEPSEAIAEILWLETARALGHAVEELPPHRIIKEKRATFSQTPAEIARRPPTKTRWPNLHLAGDWIDTGLPATIEGAVRSGNRAADAILQQRRNIAAS
jgi:squalene-associated FAD-dependent desaturase